TSCLCFIQLLTIELARLFQEGAYERQAIVRVGPGPGLKGTRLETEGYFGIDAVAQINAVSLVLGRGEQEFAQGQDAGVQIDRSRLGIWIPPSQFGFEVVAPPFDLHQAVGGEKLAEDQQFLAKSGTHARFVVSRLIEVVDRTGQRHAPKDLLQALPSPGARLGMTTEDCHDEQ